MGAINCEGSIESEMYREEYDLFIGIGRSRISENVVALVILGRIISILRYEFAPCRTFWNHRDICLRRKLFLRTSYIEIP